MDIFDNLFDQFWPDQVSSVDEINQEGKMSIPIISIVGKSGCGKTTFLEKLIPELKSRRLRIATVKHHSHAGFDIDRPGKDSWRHAQAGSDLVIIAAPDKIASYRRLEKELTLSQIASGIKDVDLILTEGYKRAGMPMIEVVRADHSLELISAAEQRLAIVSDRPMHDGGLRFDLDDMVGIADLIVERYIST